MNDTELIEEARRVNHDLARNALGGRVPVIDMLVDRLQEVLAAHDAEVRQAQADYDAVRVDDLTARLATAERSLAEQGERPCHLPHTAPPCIECKCGSRETWDTAHDRGYRAGFEAAAELAEQGEPEWEYGVEYDVSSTETVFTAAHSEAMARKWVEESPTDTGLRRRRAAGPWLPVEENRPHTEGTDR